MDQWPGDSRDPIPGAPSPRKGSTPARMGDPVAIPTCGSELEPHPQSGQMGLRFPRKAAIPSRATGITPLAAITSLA
jgi:hypothetical protein